MKILMLCEFFDEALQFQENLLVSYYRKHGHEVTVITSTYADVFDFYACNHDAGLPGRDYHVGGARIIKLPYRKSLLQYRNSVLNRLRRYTDITPFLEGMAPDLIYVHDIMPNLPEVVRYMKKTPGCKAIMDYHADYSNSGRSTLSLLVLHKLLRGRILHQARPFFSKIFPIVPTGFTFLNEVYGVPLEEMELLPLGADIDRVQEVQAQQRGADVRKKLGIAPDSIVIFSGGKFEPRKRFGILVGALKKLENNTVHLILAGDAAPSHTAYKASVLEAARGMENVHFTGWLSPEEVYIHLAAADLAVFPASQSVMWQQSIASNLPLVVGNTGNQSISYLNLHDNIIILEKEDIAVDPLMKVIDQLVSDPQRMATMAAGARKVAKQELDWNSLIDRTLRFAEDRA